MDFLSFFANKALDSTYKKIAVIISQAEDLSSKVEHLIEEPYKTGLSCLHLSQRYPDDSPRQLDELQKAVDNFKRSASLCERARKSRSLYLAGICSEILDDHVAQQYFYETASQALVEHDQEAVKAVASLLLSEHVFWRSTIEGIGVLALLSLPFQGIKVYHLLKYYDEEKAYVNKEMRRVLNQELPSPLPPNIPFKN
jgi:hypothetical protein